MAKGWKTVYTNTNTKVSIGNKSNFKTFASQFLKINYVLQLYFFLNIYKVYYYYQSI